MKDWLSVVWLIWVAFFVGLWISQCVWIWLRENSPVRVSLLFAWYDFWVGAYWSKESRTLYVLPIPMFGVKIKIKEA